MSSIGGFLRLIFTSLFNESLIPSWSSIHCSLEQACKFCDKQQKVKLVHVIEMRKVDGHINTSYYMARG